MTNTPNPTITPSTDAHDMVVVHRVFRRELRLIPELIRATAAGDLDRAGVVAGHARLVLDGLHMHHTSEDDHVWPLLLARSERAAEVVERMQAQHAAVEDLLERLTPALARFVAEARPAVAREVADLMDELHRGLVDHLDEEEAVVLPLIAGFMTPAEWAAVGEASVAKMSKAELPLMFGLIMEDADADERQAMLAVLPTPAKILMRVWGLGHSRRYIRNVRGAR